MKALALAVGISALVIGGIESCSADEIHSWARLEKQFGEGVVIESFSKHVKSNSTFQALVAGRRLATFIEMSVQTNAPGLQLVGLYGVLELAPKTALDIAFKLALAPGSEKHALELYPLFKELPMESGFDDALTSAFQTSPVDVPAATALVQLLPEERLRQWFESTRRPWVVPTYEAISLGRLYEALNRQKKLATQRMKETLATFASLPGMPRVVYLQYTSEAEPMYTDMMKLGLEDDSLLNSVLLGLVRTKADFISRHIDLSALIISEERRKLISTALTKNASFRAPDGKNLVK